MNSTNLTTVKLQRHFVVHQHASNLKLLMHDALFQITQDGSLLDYPSMTIRLLDPTQKIWDVQIPFYHSSDFFSLSCEELEKEFQKSHTHALYEYDDELEELQNRYVTAYLNDECKPSFCAKLQQEYANFNNVNFDRLWKISVYDVSVRDNNLCIRIGINDSLIHFYQPENFWNILNNIS